MLPPILRSKLYRPLALPISSLGRHAMAVVESGTKTHPEPKPLMRMAHKNVHCQIDRFTSPNHKLQTPNRHETEGDEPSVIQLRSQVCR